MKIKKIMLITLLLFAVLTIGAVSAADDTVSENLTVTDETASDNLAVDDAVANDDLIGTKYKTGYHEIVVTEEEEIDTEDTSVDNEVAHVDLPSGTKGSFRIYNGDVIVARQDFKAEYETEEDEGYGWYDDGDDICGYITMNQFDLTKVNDGDVLTFKFFELINNEYTEIDMFTLKYAVTLSDTSMWLTEVGATDTGLEEGDVNIQVNNINSTQPDKNFTYVEVAKKAGFFIITVETENDEVTIFMENLNVTNRNYVIVKDETNKSFYRFGFSFNDINNYLANTEYLSFDNFVDVENIGEDDYITFYLSEDDDPYNEITSKEMTLTFRPDGIILLKDEDADVDVDYNYDNMEITMNEGWQDNDLLTFAVKNGIKGKIVIYLNDNESPAFEKNIADLNESDDDGDFKYYTITIGDLNITQAGEYLIRDYFINETGAEIYKYDEDYPETLKLNENQSSVVDNVEIVIEPSSMYVDGNEHFITISKNASADEYVHVSIDGGESIPIKLNDTRRDDEENYIIGTEELGIRPAAGLHTVNITFRNQNRSGNITLKSNLKIEIESKETIYTTFKNSFVEITLEEAEILKSDINGTIKVIIKDADGKVVDTFESNITKLEQDDESYLILASVDKGLNGTYNVIVSYSNGNEIDTEAQANVTFKAFDPKDCDVVIKESIKNNKDHAITFVNLPQTAKIYVEIVEENIIQFDVSEEVEPSFDNEKGVYYIEFNKLGELSDGTHSIKVYVESANHTEIVLASGNVTVDVVENIDPELIISIANITEGKDAVINIKTHANYTGIIPVQIGNATYNVNVTNGTGSLAVPGLTAGNYNATAVFNANAFYNASTKNTTFTVKAKVATSISAANVATTYATSKNIIVTLKDANGNVLAEKIVSVVFNGKTSTVQTNANGQVSLAIGTKLAPKTYPITFSFAGDDELLASSGSANVIVKKAKAKLTAKKKTFKAKKKIKKYTITLKSDKGKAIKKAKVTIKVKGKTYKAKTNSKGKATFKIKKLTKKGKHKATVKFAGNKYYNKVTKKVKITVKK